MFEKGLLLGISLSFMIGPLLFTIIQASLEDGFKAGFCVAAGMWVSDVVFMGLILLGLEQLSSLNILSEYKDIITIVGGIVILSFGLGSIIASKKAAKLADELENSPQNATSQTLKPKSNHVYLFRGFLLNTINPGTIFFWLGLITAAILPNQWTKSALYLFFTGLLISLISTDLLKIYAAKKLKQILTPHHIRKIQTSLGAILVIFGLVLIVKEFIIH
jgi:threonine/homoserine/homoserine lactone efflux protein